MDSRHGAWSVAAGAGGGLQGERQDGRDEQYALFVRAPNSAHNHLAGVLDRHLPIASASPPPRVDAGVVVIPEQGSFSNSTEAGFGFGLSRQPADGHETAFRCRLDHFGFEPCVERVRRAHHRTWERQSQAC